MRIVKREKSATKMVFALYVSPVLRFRRVMGAIPASAWRRAA